MVKNLDSSKPTDPDCIPVVVLNHFEPGLSYILAELFNMCLKESCFLDCWKVLSVVHVFKNVGEGLQLHAVDVLVFSLWLVKCFKNLGWLIT